MLNSEHDTGFKSDSGICDLGKKHPFKKKKMYLSALIQSGTIKRIVSFAVCTLRHPELKGTLSCYSSTYFRSIFMQIYVFVNNSSGVALSEISLVNFNLKLILSLE